MEPKPTYKTFTANTDATPRQTGTVKWFDKVKGYGFITPDDGGAEVFVHYSAIEGDGYRNLYQDDRVTYDLVERGKGPQAQNVQARGGAARNQKPELSRAALRPSLSPSPFATCSPAWC